MDCFFLSGKKNNPSDGSVHAWHVHHDFAGDAVKVKKLQLLVSNPTNLGEGPSFSSRSGWRQTGPMEVLHVFAPILCSMKA